MKTYASRLIGLWALFLSSFALQAQDRLSLEQAIEMALAHDARIEEKKAFVRKAEGLLQEAQGSEGFRYMVDSFLAIATGVGTLRVSAVVSEIAAIETNQSLPNAGRSPFRTLLPL